MLDAVVADPLRPRNAYSPAVPSVAGLPRKQSTTIGFGAFGTIARFARDETIFSEGDEARYCYKVIGGAVRVSKVMLDGRRQIVDFLLADDLFAIDGDETHVLTAEAIGTVVLARYSRANLQRLSEDAPELRREILTALRRDLAAAQHHLLMLGRQSARERLASFLLLLANRRKHESGNRVDLPMSRQDMADYLGLTIETVCRTFAELKRLNVVATAERQYVVICNPNVLRAIAAGIN
jgi:CRP/FNR family nitrogen fixation transcriptional regulator